MELLLSPPGLRCAALRWEDADALQQLLVACTGYFASAERRAVSPREGIERTSEALGDEDQALLGVTTDPLSRQRERVGVREHSERPRVPHPSPLPQAGEGIIALVDVRFHTPEPETATIALLLIHPAHRRRGHAAALVTEIARTTTELGITALHLGIRNGAAGAHAFWEAQGFEETGRGAGVTEYVRTLA